MAEPKRPKIKVTQDGIQMPGKAVEEIMINKYFLQVTDFMIEKNMRKVSFEMRDDVLLVNIVTV